MKKKLTRPLVVIDRKGPEDYSATLSMQTNLLEARINDKSIPDTIILVEHAHVITRGRGTPEPALPEIIKDKIPSVEISRGGKVTYHGPGQLIAYPIFNLENFGKDVHVFLRMLEDVIISTLSCFGIRGERREGLTGVWVNLTNPDNSTSQSDNFLWKKIASIGIGVRKWHSYHGFALNVNPDLSFFSMISPCGQDGKVITSLSEILKNKTPKMDDVKIALLNSFSAIFSLEIDENNLESNLTLKRRARPSWLKVKAPGSPQFQETVEIVRNNKLVTVCEEARCPNMGECWSHGTATFMIMGDQCTRRCSFCSVKDGDLENLSPLDPLEPIRVATAVQKLALRHVVITSVNRDDAPDMGALHFHQTVKAIKHLSPDCDVELLIPDMRGRRELVETILQSGLVKVLNHNTETVPRLYKTVRPGAQFKRSLKILEWAKEISPGIKTKSGLMAGLGETKEEVIQVLLLLRESKVDIITIGQYLQPTPKQLPVYRYVTPEEFKEYEELGLSLGFSHVESGPLVRSSYHAWKHTGDLAEPRFNHAENFQHLSNL
ncbi:MAG TPA: lipoyl synthase [Oligoflexia bacterium]|mgnify:CR=1 FL=1|nr:lipoyl synthase [Oligoflexia bacterium]HMP48335.1 lipoyl synthase [Oligoflexia bacterium]